VLRKVVMLAEPERVLTLMDVQQALGTDPMSAGGHQGVSQPDEAPLRSLPRLETDAIAAALRQTQGNVTEAARLLGIGRATLYRRLARRGAPPQRS
jgi:transcriptional regulator of acetoin/glycerol metabolism